MKYEKIYSGKVRDIYQINQDRIILVASDRISAFDVIFPQIVAGKGELLTKISNFWFNKLKHIAPNHIIETSVKKYVSIFNLNDFEGRSVVVKNLSPFPFEIIVRGYLYGAAFREYQESGSIGGEKFPKGLKLCSKFTEPLFSATTKAPLGGRDEPISIKKLIHDYGSQTIEKIKYISTQTYLQACDFALSRGIIIGDTKFEFGFDKKGEITLMDELLTPDSSRYWDVIGFKEGNQPRSMDKQILRNWLQVSGWNPNIDPVFIPDHILSQMSKEYENIYKRLTMLPDSL